MPSLEKLFNENDNFLQNDNTHPNKRLTSNKSNNK